MDNQLFYLIQSDGLKPHLSTDSEGIKSLCGRKMRKTPLKVKEVDELNPLDIGFVCHKCLKAVGLIEE